MDGPLAAVAGLVLLVASLVAMRARRPSRPWWSLWLPTGLAALATGLVAGGLGGDAGRQLGAILLLIGSLMTVLGAVHACRVVRERELLEERSRALLEDLTQNAEEASSRLEASERRVHDLVEVAPVGFFESDADGRLHSVSERWRSLAGFDVPRANGASWLEVIDPVDRERVASAWRAAVSRGIPFQEEYRIEREHGLTWVLCHSVPRRGADGAIVGHVGTITDVTERKQQEAEHLALEGRVRQSQKIESLATLAGGIAHDFNNLLVGILGNAEIVASRLAADSPIQRTIERIKTASLRAADLAGQMLAYAGRGEPVIGPVDVSALVTEMGQLLEASLPAAVRLEYELAPDVPRIEADATQIRQVVMNLITNAAEAMEETGGVVRVSTTVVEADRALLKKTFLNEPLAEGRYVSLEVSDGGSGISSDLVERIFDPFFSTKVSGRGLGLAVVLGIVRGHGGAMVVETDPGSGTTMTALLPAVAAGMRAPRAPVVDRSRDLDAWRGHGEVLVVDDETLVLIVAEIMLKESGFQVHIAADGEEGLEVYRRHAAGIRLVLLDVTMPGLSGHDVLERIRAISDDVKVILTSGYPEREVLREFADLGPDGFVKKPFRAPDLLGKVREVLDVGDELDAEA